MENTREVVWSFYNECMTVNETVCLEAKMKELLADDFQSICAKESIGKEEMIEQTEYYWHMVPDLKWEPKQIYQDGDRVIVLSMFSGTPNGFFMGLNLDGTKAFNTMAIDIHTVENGKIKTIYHIEEWSTAIAQMVFPQLRMQAVGC